MNRNILRLISAACILALTGCALQPHTSDMQDESLTIITKPYANMLTGETASPEEICADMTLREKIGQMLMPDFRTFGADSAPVTELNDAQIKALRSHHFGGVILFSENIQNTEQAVQLVDAMQCANAQGGRTGLLIAADSEGGQVSRLTTGTMLCGNMALGAADSETLTKQASGILGEELAALGINTDFAPSFDVNSDPANPVIGVRSFSDDPERVMQLGCAYVQGLQDKGIIPAVKHFPGHGDTDVDSHTGLPLIDKSLAALEALELIPFRAQAADNADMIMTAHIQYPQIEEDTYASKADGSEIYLPATLSDDIILKYLRGGLGFDGVVITDAMNMDAIREHFDPLDAARLAINAGVDMLLMSVETATEEELDGIWNYISGIENMVKNGEIPEARIDESVLRILKLKEKYGLLAPIFPTAEETEAKARAAAETVGSKAHHDTEREITRQAVTLVKNEDALLPLDGSSKTVLVCPYDSELNSLEYAAEQLRAEGIVPKDSEMICQSYESAEPAKMAKLIDGAETVIAVSALYSAEELDPASEEGAGAAYLDALLAQTHENDAKFVLISAQLPYDIARYPDADAALACYLAKGMAEKPDDSGDVSAAYGPNLVAALYTVFGGNAPTGTLPVSIPEINESYQYTDEILYKRGTGLSYEE